MTIENDHYSPTEYIERDDIRKIKSAVRAYSGVSWGNYRKSFSSLNFGDHFMQEMFSARSCI